MSKVTAHEKIKCPECSETGTLFARYLVDVPLALDRGVQEVGHVSAASGEWEFFSYSCQSCGADPTDEDILAANGIEVGK